MAGKSRYTYNTKFFNELNHTSAYWAGFIAADGNLSSAMNEVSINLSIDDRQHLQRLKETIEFSGDIKVRKDCRAVRLRLNHAQEWCEDLSRLHITPQKTLTLRPPDLNGDLAMAYIAGYLDGDGWVTNTTNRTSCVVGVMGTLEMVEWIQSEFAKLVPSIAERKLTRRKCTAEIYQLQIQKGSREVYEHFLRLDVPLLERKWNKFIMM